MGRPQYGELEPLQKKRKRRAKKDPNKPKRAITAYFFFMNEYREKCKIAGRDYPSVGEFTKDAASKWRQMDIEARKPYEKMSAKDKLRHDEEMKHYVPVTASGRVKAIKDPNAPKRPMTGFFLFMNEFREKNPNSPLSHKQKVSQAAAIWREQMTQEQRQPYEIRAAQLKIEYEKKMEAYRAETASASLSSASKNGAGNTIEIDSDEDAHDTGERRSIDATVNSWQRQMPQEHRETDADSAVQQRIEYERKMEAYRAGTASASASSGSKNGASNTIDIDSDEDDSGEDQ